MKRYLGPAWVLVPLGLAICLSLFGDQTLYAVLVTQLDEVGLSLAGVGIMLGANRLIRIPGNPLAGVLVDRWGRRRLIILGMLLGALSTASYGLVRGFWPFLAGRLMWGVAWTLINVGGMAIVLDVSVHSNRGRLTGLYNSWLLAGLAIGPLAGGLMVDRIGFRPTMLACAGLTAAGLVVAAVAVPETAPFVVGGPLSEPRGASDLGRNPSETWRRARTLLRANRALLAASGLALVVQFASRGVLLSTISLLLQQRFGERVVIGSLMLGVASAGGALLGLRSLLASAAGPLAGQVSDIYTGRRPVIGASLLGGAAGFSLLSLATSVELVVLGVALGAISTGAAMAALAAWVGDMAPSGRQGVVMGAYATAGDVGSMAGPFLVFPLLSVVDIRWVYLFCALILVCAVGLVWRRRDDDQ